MSDLDPVLAEPYDRELIFHGFTPYMRDYEMVLYEPSTRTRSTVLSRDTSASSLGTALSPPSPPGPGLTYGSGPLATTSSGCGTSPGLDRLRLGRGGPGGLPGCHGLQGSKRAAYWADQLGTAFHEVLVEANPQTIGLVFSEATVAEVTPVICPSSLRPRVTPKPTPRASICVRTQGPSTRTGHPMGHARARGPSLAQCASEGRCGIRIVDRLYWSLQ